MKGQEIDPETDIETEVAVEVVVEVAVEVEAETEDPDPDPEDVIVALLLVVVAVMVVVVADTVGTTIAHLHQLMYLECLVFRKQQPRDSWKMCSTSTEISKRLI